MILLFMVDSAVKAARIDAISSSESRSVFITIGEFRTGTEAISTTSTPGDLVERSIGIGKHRDDVPGFGVGIMCPAPVNIVEDTLVTEGACIGLTGQYVEKRALVGTRRT